MAAMNDWAGGIAADEGFTDYALAPDGDGWVVLDNHRNGAEVGTFATYDEAEVFAEGWLVEQGF